jgi:fatty acid synthase subunit alpha
MSSSGPVKIPVGAWCVHVFPLLTRSALIFALSATALQSLEIACDTLLSGKAKVMIAGGFDDISEEGSYEFANMKATSNAETELAMGREPTEMSRPATTTRAGVSDSLYTKFLLFLTVYLFSDSSWKLKYINPFYYLKPKLNVLLQGTGVHIVMSAKTALELGAPIRGVLAFTSTSTYVLQSYRFDTR